MRKPLTLEEYKATIQTIKHSFNSDISINLINILDRARVMERLSNEHALSFHNSIKELKTNLNNLRDEITATTLAGCARLRANGASEMEIDSFYKSELDANDLCLSEAKVKTDETVKRMNKRYSSSKKKDEKLITDIYELYDEAYAYYIKEQKSISSHH